jgi:hypothetical protein
VNIVETWRSDWHRPITDPLPEDDGVVLRFTRGDVAWPILDPDGWFGVRYPWVVIRFRSWIPLPFFAWKWGRWMGYIGFKVYGVDNEVYKLWLPQAEVHPGSMAMHPSFRPFASRK